MMLRNFFVVYPYVVLFLSTKKEKREEDNIRKKKSHFLQILFYLYSNASTRYAEEESQVRLGDFACWVCSMMLSWSQISRRKLGRQTWKCGAETGMLGNSVLFPRTGMIYKRHREGFGTHVSMSTAAHVGEFRGSVNAQLEHGGIQSF